MTKRIAVGFTLLAAGFFVPGATLAQAERSTDYPNRPIRLVVPFGPGGGSDYVGRLVGQKLSAQMGQQVVVDNRPGAASLVGTEIVARAAADGYTLCLCDVGFTINPAYYRKTTYDPIKSFDPVMVVAETPYILVVNPGLPYVSSIKDFIAAAKAQPGKINLGSAGSGSGTHFSGELVKQRAGINLVHVPYKGTGQAMGDLLGGQVVLMFDQPVSSLPHVKTGKLKVLGISSGKRFPTLQEIPTIAEQGLAGFEAISWSGVCAPGRTPADIVHTLRDPDELDTKLGKTDGANPRVTSLILNKRAARRAATNEDHAHSGGRVDLW